MLRIYEQVRLSEFENLYMRIIPKTNLLRRIKELVDFSFIIDELSGKYSADMGRAAINPIILFKYLLLKCLFRLSDRDVVEQSRYDMSFKYFLGYRPEDDVISPSELTKFRKQRLVDEDILDKLLKKSVEIAVEQGIVLSRNIIVDSTHSSSKYHNRSPQEVLQEQAKALRKAVYKIDVTMKEKFPAKVISGEIEMHIEYCRNLLEIIEGEGALVIYQDVAASANLLREMIEDNLENLNMSADKDAKVGHKSADTSFFGYKTHIAMSEEGIITAAVVTSGEKHDGKQLTELVRKTRDAGVRVESVTGDGAYSEKNNIEYANSEKGQFALVSRLSSCVVAGVRKDEDKFEFNKDAEMFVCKAGHMAVSKTKRHNKQPERKENPRMVYYFDIEVCKRCPMREGCYKEGSKSKSYSVSLVSDIQTEYHELQQTEQYKELAARRYKVEAKNGELKNRLGYKQAESSGIQAMRIQGAATLFAANIKRILKILCEK